MAYLERVKQALREKLQRLPEKKYNYHVPPLWLAAPTAKRKAATVNPLLFFLEAAEQIERSNQSNPKRRDGGEWTRQAVIYNMFVRSTCAFDHNQDGKLDLPANEDGFREVGTFLKAIALLPYIQRLGANTIHLLPISEIGHDGHKGTLGSPYAIKNPYRLDETLAEPALGLGAEVEFGAFVESAHRLGMRVVIEFVFRTASKDSDWIPEHPEWFYWIREEIPDREPSSTDETRYGPPVFSDGELRRIIGAAEQKRFDLLLPPHKGHRSMFTDPPRSGKIRKEGGRFIGTLDDGTRVRIPGGFADWPPNDTQPPWGDVTYLKMYDHPEFNYMSYNTVRMYDTRLARREHANYPLWNKIAGIIPHFQQTFGIDGVMIDMGHALPMELKQTMVQKAQTYDPDFAFWDENFSVTPKSREEGYNAVIGYCWSDHHHIQKFRKLLERCGQDGFPIPFFATPESHNTPRAAARRGGVMYARAASFVDSFIPAIPFIHSGIELGETYPINTGLDFTREELKLLPSEQLPLFSEYAYDWFRKEQFSDWIGRVGALRRKFANLIGDFHPSTFRLLDAKNDLILAFLRTSSDGSQIILAITSFDFGEEQSGIISPGIQAFTLTELLSGREYEIRNGTLELRLAPGECLVLAL